MYTVLGGFNSANRESRIFSQYDTVNRAWPSQKEDSFHPKNANLFLIFANKIFSTEDN